MLTLQSFTFSLSWPDSMHLESVMGLLFFHYFSNATQISAKTVKDDVRNEWAHCDFAEWDPVKFQSCFKEMQQLVQSLGLPVADETKILSELNDWENKGNLI